MKPEEPSKWHVDRTIPLALIIALLTQTAGAVWWARGIDARIEALEKGDAGRTAQATQLNDIAIEIAALKERTDSVKEDVAEIKSSVELLTNQALQEKSRR